MNKPTPREIVYPSEYDLSEFHEAVSDLLHYVKYNLPYGSPTLEFQWKIEKIQQAIKPIEVAVNANAESQEWARANRWLARDDELEGGE